MTTEYDELNGIYNDVDRVIEAAGFACLACGKCCDFSDGKFELWASRAEVEHMVGCGGRVAVAGAVCPYREVSGRCGNRAGRTLGCRVYFCRGQSQRISEVYEAGLRRIREMCRRRGLGWEYGRVLKMLAGEDVIEGERAARGSFSP